MTTKTDATTRWLRVEGDLGSFVIEGDQRCVTHLYLPDDLHPPSLRTAGAEVGPALAAAAEQLEEYLAGRRKEFDLPLDPVPEGTVFQRMVWATLAEIPYGTTISYAELARWVRHPRAFRAVGQANGANPLPVFWPCHRVVASDGGIGGYGGGLDLKRRLLALEGHPLGTS